MKYLTVICLLFTCFFGKAQNVDGTWEGTITLERPAPHKEFKFQLKLKRDGKKVVGTSYIFFEDQPVAMNLSGRYFYDQSMRLFNNEVLYPSQDTDKDRHIRKYQIMYKRSVFGDTIEGYWQEKNDPIFAKYRKGRVYLKRVEKVNKA
jgi:hypothetical protein